MKRETSGSLEECFAVLAVVFLVAAGTPARGQEAPSSQSDPATAVVTDGAATPASAAVVPTAGDANGGVAAGAPALEAVQARLAEIEADATIEDVVKSAVKPKYEEAIGLLEQALENTKRAALYKQTLVTGPGDITELRAQLQALPAPGAEPGLPEGLDDNTPAAELEQRLSTQRTELASLEANLTDTKKKLSEEESRPSLAIERLSAAGPELTAVQEALAAQSATAPSGPAAEAQTYILQARQAALQSEIELLEQERLSFPIREQILEARRDLLTRQVELAEGGLEATREFADRRANVQVNQAAMLAAKARETAPGEFPGLLALADDLEQLSAEGRQLAKQIETVRKTSDESEERLKSITKEFDSIRKQIEIGGLEEVFAQILLDQRNRLPRGHEYRSKLSARKKKVSALRLGAFRVEEAIGAQGDLEEEVAAIVGDADVEPEIRREITDLVESRRKFRDDLRKEYRRLLDMLGQLDLTERQYLEVVGKFSDFLKEKLFWVASSPRVGVETFQELPAAAQWLAGPGRWKELASALKAIPLSLYAVLAGLMALLILPRRRMRTRLRESGERTRRISSDRYGNTTEALIMTLLLALPGSVALAFFGWQVDRSPEASTWLRGLGDAFEVMSVLLFQLIGAYVICRPRGLADAHFCWHPEMLAKMRRSILWIAPVYLIALFIVIALLKEETARHVQSLGRLTFMGTMLWLAFFLGRMFHPRSGILSHLATEHPDRWEMRLRYFWYLLAMLLPVGLAIASALGYFVSAMTLNLEMRLTLIFIGIGSVVYGLLLRWFSIGERKLALQQAIEERNARREALAAEGEEGHSDEAVLPEIEEKTLDLATVGDQTRNLLRFVISIGVVAALWVTWASTIPALKVLNQINAFGGLSVGALILGLVVLALTIAAAKNLPGLLEVAVLRNLSLDSGSRYAIATLVQYGVVAVGFTTLFNVLALDWSKFGWIAAALSVGLGFGLQEVVANFVCGIILLFERPIRVGDVVTVGGVDGIVSRIRMRATTIVNWDRKEFLVPNKEFITGTVLNWTLSNTITRVVIPVGVAYGSDTAKAEKLLLAIAHDHPEVLEDPAPMATFETFADSTLNFNLRAYLPTMENRLRTIHELHTTIHRRFGEEGIEIAFPQRDLHLRSVDPGVDFGRESETSGPKKE